MAEYIKRNGAWYDPSSWECVADACKAIKEAPAEDVAPVVHARWVPDKTGGIRCSACGKRPTLLVKTDFCPRCGAKMDLEG